MFSYLLGIIDSFCQATTNYFSKYYHFITPAHFFFMQKSRTQNNTVVQLVLFVNRIQYKFIFVIYVRKRI